MKKLIFILALIAVATLSTFPVVETEAYPLACTTPIEYSDGSAVKTCSQNGVLSTWGRKCAYCGWDLTSVQN